MYSIIKSPLIPIAITVAMFTSCMQPTQDNKSQQVVHNVFLVHPVSVDGSAVREYAGQVEEARTIAAAFKTGGTVERILVKEGDHVRKGQLLAELDSTDYVLGTGQLRVQASQLRSEVDRTTRLYASGGVSDNDYEKAKAGLRQLEYQLAINENKLAYCRLEAPSSGIITDVKFEPGELVDAGTPLFDIMDNSHLEIVVDIPVSEYLRRADFISFTGHSAIMPGLTFPLQMLSLTPRADNNQLFRLKLALSGGSDVTLAPGMNVTVSISTSGNASDAVSIPANAVFDHEGQTSVYTFNPTDSTITLTPVILSGTSTNGILIVNSGLTTDQQLVRAGVHHLVPGEKVKVIEPATGSNAGNLL